MVVCNLHVNKNHLPHLTFINYISKMDNEEIIILDFGSQYSHLIARRLRGINFKV